MMRLGAIFWLLLVATTGFAMFAVKYEVQGLDDEYARTRKAIAAEERQISVLQAEWAYLNRPAALASLNQRFLALSPLATQQLAAGVEGLPMRPEAPPEPAVAAAPPGSARLIAAAARPDALGQLIAVAARPDALGQLIAQLAGR